MKTIALLLLLCGMSYTPPFYWEQMTLEQQQDVLQLEGISANAVEYYEGNSSNAEDIDILSLLETLIQPQSNLGVKAFYFNVFNKVVTTSDGKLNQILPPYIVDIVVNEPQYILNYFIRNSEMMQTYASLLGKAFFNQNESSNGLCTFDQFQNQLTRETIDYPQFQTIQAEFFYFIQKTINEQRRDEHKHS